MVKYYTGELDVTFMALCDATRRAILKRLSLGDCTVTQLAEPFSMSLPAVSKHLRILENAGLLSRKKEGRIYRCHLEAKPMKEAADWITKYKVFWEDKFNALEKYLEETKGKEKE